MYSDTIRELRQIREACIGMVQAWYGKNPDLMQRILHEDFAGQGVLADSATGHRSIQPVGKQQMIDKTRRGEGFDDDEQWNIEATILDATEKTATVKVRSACHIDICQVVKIDEQWKILNVLRTARQTTS